MREEAGTRSFAVPAETDRTAKSHRLLVVAVIAIPTLYALWVNFPALDNPPAWDSATTVSPAAIAIVQSDFHVWDVAQQPGTLEGGPSTHATSVYTIGLAVLLAVFGPSGGFFIAHLMSIVLLGVLVGATYGLARERLDVRASALVAIAVGTLPIVVQQSADIYLDLPLAVLTTVACWATVRRKFWLTAGLVFAGVAFKTSGVFLLPLLLMAKPSRKPWGRHLVHVTVGGIIAALPFVVALINTDRFEAPPSLESHVTLLRSAASLLILTIDVLVILSTYFLVIYGRTRNGSLDRTSKVSCVLVASFLGAHLATVFLSGTITILPRYYIAILPAVLVVIFPADLPTELIGLPKRIAALGFLGLLIVFSVLNRGGDFYPLPNHSFYVAAERSTRAQDLLALQVEGTRRLADTRLPIVVGLQEHFRIAYPEMGYVDETPRDVISLVDSWPRQLPERFAMLLEPRYANPVIDFERTLLDAGYTVTYEEFHVGGFHSRIAIVSGS